MSNRSSAKTPLLSQRPLLLHRRLKKGDKPELQRDYRNSPSMKISTTDPEAALSSQRGASEFAYYDNYLVDNQSCIIAGVMATPARLSRRS